MSKIAATAPKTAFLIQPLPIIATVMELLGTSPRFEEVRLCYGQRVAPLENPQLALSNVVESLKENGTFAYNQGW
ncbi:hypothetical protein CSUB01_09984 [Colletotrichum sublineola]|uniref:Uncharacterized protein n=1 Tax=Colletotrichum sublineola TaxID=1173701 RepID=A0A066XDI5_COLSU|nr:hypothetical protein CSUB01_09984 [Colletotrichum sublineola]